MRELKVRHRVPTSYFFGSAKFLARIPSLHDPTKPTKQLIIGSYHNGLYTAEAIETTTY